VIFLSTPPGVSRFSLKENRDIDHPGAGGAHAPAKINRPVYKSDMLRGNSPSQKPVGFCVATSRINAAHGRAFGSNTRIEHYNTAFFELQVFFAIF